MSPRTGCFHRENKAVVRRLVEEAFGKGNVGVVDQLVADDFVERTPMPGVAADKTGVKQTAQIFRSAFPDMTVTIEDAIAEGDRVAIRLVSRGTHKGDLMGIAPTGKAIQINEQHWVRVRDGQIVEHWGVEDNLGMMQQLGLAQQMA
jgi:steroid delta-isomerase-like uncharacterized protein